MFLYTRFLKEQSCLLVTGLGCPVTPCNNAPIRANLQRFPKLPGLVPQIQEPILVINQSFKTHRTLFIRRMVQVVLNHLGQDLIPYSKQSATCSCCLCCQDMDRSMAHHNLMQLIQLFSTFLENSRQPNVWLWRRIASEPLPLGGTTWIPSMSGEWMTDLNTDLLMLLFKLPYKGRLNSSLDFLWSYNIPVSRSFVRM